VAIAALVLWICTAAVGGYLLATSTTAGTPAPEPREPVPASQPTQATTAQPAQATAQPAKPARTRDRFDPPSLARAKSEPLPGMRALAEFAHPALAIIGLGLWLGYVLTHDRMFAAIGFGVLLGAIAAGLSWFTANTRAAKRANAGPTGTAGQRASTLSFTPRLLILHGVGAALTVLIAALIAARA
jgi:hypothetical protein